FSRTNSVGTVTNAFTFAPATTLTPITASGTFAQGFLTWTSGKNVGLTAFIRAFTPGTPGSVVLDVAPIFPLAVGDAFTISQGCDKTFAACLDFQGSTNAYKNFRGQPDTPVPETAI